MGRDRKIKWVETGLGKEDGEKRNGKSETRSA